MVTSYLVLIEKILRKQPSCMKMSELNAKIRKITTINKLADDFVKFLEEKMQRLSKVILNPNIPKHIKSVHILNLRFETFGL